MASLAIASPVHSAVACEAIQGLTATPKTLSPWLFYDEAGSRLFEEITTVAEYYPTRAERAIFEAHAEEILNGAAPQGQRLMLAELGAGTAAKTGLLLAAALRLQESVTYQPVDVSESALAAARKHIETDLPGVTVHAQVANYIDDPLKLERERNTRTLALYIGSSIGNFTPEEARNILRNLRAQLHLGDSLLLGTDLVKDESTLLAAYNDAGGVTAAFNRNVLVRLNRELGANFQIDCFEHRAIWNSRESRIEMHLLSTVEQKVRIPANADCAACTLRFAAGETIHTENSYKFTAPAIGALLRDSGFTTTRTWHDPQRHFAVTLAAAS